jgi:hypothetical protein
MANMACNAKRVVLAKMGALATLLTAPVHVRMVGRVKVALNEAVQILRRMAHIAPSYVLVTGTTRSCKYFCDFGLLGQTVGQLGTWHWLLVTLALGPLDTWGLGHLGPWTLCH